MENNDIDIKKRIMDLYINHTSPNDIWLFVMDRMIGTLISSLEWLKENDDYVLSPQNIWDDISFVEFVRISTGDKYINLPPKYREDMVAYLDSLYAYNHNIAYIHGYLQHELIPVFKELGI